MYLSSVNRGMAAARARVHNDTFKAVASIFNATALTPVAPNMVTARVSNDAYIKQLGVSTKLEYDAFCHEESLITALDMIKDLVATLDVGTAKSFQTFIQDMLLPFLEWNIPLSTLQSVEFPGNHVTSLHNYEKRILGDNPAIPVTHKKEQIAVYNVSKINTYPLQDLGAVLAFHDSGLAPCDLTKTSTLVNLIANAIDKGPGGGDKTLDPEKLLYFPSNDAEPVYFDETVMRLFGFNNLKVRMEAMHQSNPPNPTGVPKLYRITIDYGTPGTAEYWQISEIVDFLGNLQFSGGTYFLGNPVKNERLTSLLGEYSTASPLRKTEIRKEIQKYLICKELGDLLQVMLLILYGMIFPNILLASSCDKVYTARLVKCMKQLHRIHSVLKVLGPAAVATPYFHYFNMGGSPAIIKNAQLTAYKTSCTAANIEIVKIIGVIKSKGLIIDGVAFPPIRGGTLDSFLDAIAGQIGAYNTQIAAVPAVTSDDLVGSENEYNMRRLDISKLKVEPVFFRRKTKAVDSYAPSATAKSLVKGGALSFKGKPLKEYLNSVKQSGGSWGIVRNNDHKFKGTYISTDSDDFINLDEDINKFFYLLTDTSIIKDNTLRNIVKFAYTNAGINARFNSTYIVEVRKLLFTGMGSSIYADLFNLLNDTELGVCVGLLVADCPYNLVQDCMHSLETYFRHYAITFEDPQFYVFLLQQLSGGVDFLNCSIEDFGGFVMAYTRIHPSNVQFKSSGTLIITAESEEILPATAAAGAGGGSAAAAAAGAGGGSAAAPAAVVTQTVAAVEEEAATVGLSPELTQLAVAAAAGAAASRVKDEASINKATHMLTTARGKVGHVYYTITYGDARKPTTAQVDDTRQAADNIATQVVAATTAAIREGDITPKKLAQRAVQAVIYHGGVLSPSGSPRTPGYNGSPPATLSMNVGGARKSRKNKSRKNKKNQTRKANNRKYNRRTRRSKH